jgi:hypothetical protein
MSSFALPNLVSWGRIWALEYQLMYWRGHVLERECGSQHKPFRKLGRQGTRKLERLAMGTYVLFQYSIHG